MSAIAHVDGQAISVHDTAEVLRVTEAALSRQQGFTLFTLNLDHLVKRRQSATFRDAYTRATFVSADGWPVVALARRVAPGLRRTTGADLVLPLCRMAARRRIPVYLFGTSHASLIGAALELRRLCPGLDLRDLDAPALGFEPASVAGDKAAAKIAASGAKLCFVALGAPKQEMFVDRARALCPDVGFVCVGAALDFLAGLQTRAPEAVQNMGLEWAWRLAKNPRRLALRYLRCAILFAQLLLDTRQATSDPPPDQASSSAKAA